MTMQSRANDRAETGSARTATVAALCLAFFVRHGRHGLRRRAALRDVLPGHRLWRHHAARRAVFRPHPRPHDHGPLRRQCVRRPALGVPAGPARRDDEDRRDRADRATRRPTSSTQPSAGRAAFNVTPELAGAYFNKVECFCFTDTTLKPGETLDMPVVFYRRSGHRRRAGTEGHQDDHAFLHLLPDRDDKPMAADRLQGRTGTQSAAESCRRKARGLTWPTRTRKHHDYHIIDPSPWPFIGSVGALVMAIGGVAWMQYLKGGEFHAVRPRTSPAPGCSSIGLLIVLYTMFGWWSDTIKEAHEGHHTRVVSLHLRYGMIMFIASEVMFFVAWFWAFFDASLFPDEVASGRARRIHRRRLAAEGHRGPRSLPPAALQHRSSCCCRARR